MYSIMKDVILYNNLINFSKYVISKIIIYPKLECIVSENEFVWYDGFAAAEATTNLGD